MVMLWSQPYLSSSYSFFASGFKCYYPRSLISSLLPRTREVNLHRHNCVSVLYSAELVCHSSNTTPNLPKFSWSCHAPLVVEDMTGNGIGQAETYSSEEPSGLGQIELSLLRFLKTASTGESWNLSITQNKVINQNLLFWGKCPRKQGFEALHQLFLIELTHFSLNAEMIFSPERKDNVAVRVCFCQVQQLQSIPFFWCLWSSSERVKDGSGSFGSHGGP